MAVFPFAKQLTSNTGTNIVEIISVYPLVQKIKSQFSKEYWLDINIILEALDCASNLSDLSMAQAPYPAIEITDNAAQKATTIADNWRNYPAIGLQLYVDFGTGQYLKKGQPIVIQNTPIQFPLPLIAPYLNATAAVFLLGENSRIGIQIVSGGNWQQIKGNDYLTITGALRIAIEPKEKIQIPIQNWRGINCVLPANTPTKVLVQNQNRRYLSLQNAGTADIYCGFGSTINIGMGNLITPKGTINIEFERYFTPSEFWAISPNADGLIVGQEGTI